MSHYFKNDETLTNKQIDFEVKIKDIVLNLRTNSGVFSKSKLDLGTKLLLETIELEEKTKIVIDMGCGYGPIGIYIAKKYPDKKVFMYDINEKAVDLSKINANLNDVEDDRTALVYDRDDIEASLSAFRVKIKKRRETNECNC